MVGALGEPCGDQSVSVTCPSGSSSGSIVPSTLAGDQLVFTSQQTCYRVYYDKTKQALSEVAASPTGTPCSQIAPPGAIAGPNTDDPASTSDPVFDGAGTVSPSPLLTNLNNEPDESADPLSLSIINVNEQWSNNSLLEQKLTQYNATHTQQCSAPPYVPVFVYLDKNENLICPDINNNGADGPDFEASSQSQNSWYQNANYGTGAGYDIGAIVVTIYAQVQNDSSPTWISQETVDLDQPESQSLINVGIPTITTPNPITASASPTLTSTPGDWVAADGTTPALNDCSATITTNCYSYQWEDCDAEGASCQPVTNGGVNGSNDSTGLVNNYTVQANDSGETLRLVVTAKNLYGSVEATSAPTSVIQ